MCVRNASTDWELACSNSLCSDCAHRSSLRSMAVDADGETRRSALLLECGLGWASGTSFAGGNCHIALSLGFCFRGLEICSFRSEADDDLLAAASFNHCSLWSAYGNETIRCRYSTGNCIRS